MAEHKNLSKELKKPDALQRQGLQLVNYLVAQKKLLAFVGGLVCLTAVLVVAFSFYADSRKETRLEDLGEVESFYRSELKAAEDAVKIINQDIAATQETIDSLQSKQRLELESVSKYKTDAQVGEIKKMFVEDIAKAEKEKTELEAKREEVMPNHEYSAKLYQDFFEKHNETPEGWYAGIRSASYFKQKGEEKGLERAEKILSSIAVAANDNKTYRVLANLGLLSIKEDKKEYDNALKIITTLEESVTTELMPKILFAKSRILRATNQNQKAMEVLDELINLKDVNPAELDQAKKLKAVFHES